MKKNLLIVATILFAASLLFLTPFIGGGQARLSDDGLWRDCTISSTDLEVKGCYLVTFVFPRLTTEERAFKEKLGTFPHPPLGITKEDMVRVMGREPDQTIEIVPGAGRYKWNNFGPGNDPQRGVIIHTYSGQFKDLLWFQPNRFILSYGVHTEK